MKVLIAVVVASAAALCGCFNPSYGPGGFACNSGQCPEGYTCVTVDGSRVCRKGTADRSLGDLVGDRSQLDGARGEARIDLRRDVGRDQLFDKPGILGCPYTEAIPNTGVVPKLPLSFDLVTDGVSQPHVVFVDGSTGNLQHAMRAGTTWTTTQVKTTSGSNQVAAAMEPGNPNLLHVVRRGVDGSNQRIFHVWRQLTAAWSSENKVSSTLDIGGLDVGASSAGVHMVAYGKDGGNATFAAWLAKPSGPSYIYSLLNSHSMDLTEGRVGVGPTQWSYTAYSPSAAQWWLRAGPVGAATTVQQAPPNSAANVAMPAPVAVDATGNRHYVYARSPGTPATLYYLSWPAASPTTFESKPGPGAAAPASVDLALDANSRPCISFSELTQVRVLCYTGSSWQQRASVTASGAFTRLAVAKNGTLYVAYLASAPNELRMTCVLP